MIGDIVLGFGSSLCSHRPFAQVMRVLLYSRMSDADNTLKTLEELPAHLEPSELQSDVRGNA